MPDVVGAAGSLTLQDHQLWLVGMGGRERMRLEFAESFCELHVICGTHVLVAEEQHLVTMEELFELGDEVVVSACIAEVDVGHLRSEGR